MSDVPRNRVPIWADDLCQSIFECNTVRAFDILNFGDLRLPEFAVRHATAFAVVLSHQIEGEKFEVLICAHASFPLIWPRVFLLNWKEHLGRPHVDFEKDSASVCYIHEEGNAVDLSAPKEVFLEVIARVVAALTAGGKSTRAKEIEDEFELYWRRLPHCREARFRIDNLNEASTVRYWKDGKGEILFIGDQINSQKKAAEMGWKHAGSTGLYVPLKRLELDDFSHSSKFSTGALQRLIGMPRQWAAAVLKAMPDRSHKTQVVVFGYDSNSQQRIFGVRIKTNGQGHPLNDRRVWRDVTPLVMVADAQTILIQRGGGQAELEGKKVLIVGCGSLGGNTATFLAKAGIGHLTLVDSEIFEAGNVQRHVLGKWAVNKAKVEALKDILTKGCHQLTVEPIRKRIEDLVNDQSFNWNQFDVIVSGTGSHRADRLLNQYLWENKISVPLLAHWVEAYGVGGHVVASKYQHDQTGCLECLFTKEEGADFRGCALAFTEPGQRVGKVITGCAGTFTPFGYLDSIRCSELLARRALKILSGEWDGFTADSFKGDRKSADEAGLVLSSRYQLSNADLDSQRLKWASHRCPVCSCNVTE
jgi:molybdopterin-synthase adenylyltransferase